MADLSIPNGIVQVAGFGYHEPSAENAWWPILRFLARHLQIAPGEHR